MFAYVDVCHMHGYVCIFASFGRRMDVYVCTCARMCVCARIDYKIKVDIRGKKISMNFISNESICYL